MAEDRCDMYDRYRVDKVFRAAKILKVVAQAKEPMTLAQMRAACKTVLHAPDAKP